MAMLLKNKFKDLNETYFFLIQEKESRRYSCMMPPENNPKNLVNI